MSSIHSNISIFVPHIGCPHKCSFCDQRHITGVEKAPQPEDVEKAVEIAIKTKNYNPKTTEIAFFGGSFTAIETEYMLLMLETAYKYVKNKTVKGIRVSTRPDAIDDNILTVLKTFGVTSIELGAQSMCDEVLKENERGHTAKDVINASNLIKKYGIGLGLQMMTGLYKSSFESDIYTANEIIKLKPDTVRIYPTIILENTNLARLCKSGTFVPPTLEESIQLCAKLLPMFEKANIKVIRLGLHTINTDAYVAGPWHPAFSELVENNIYLNNFYNELKSAGNYIIYVAQNSLSKAIGQNKSNIIKLAEKGFACKISADNKLTGRNFYIKGV